MNRRDSLKLMALAGVVGAIPLAAGISRARPLLVYDGRFREAKALARLAGQSHDCQFDAARLWYDRLASDSGHGPIEGLTTEADRLVFADCARRAGHALVIRRPLTSQRQLVFWIITQKDRA